MPGILYVVATPIGNLEDITLRALRVLKEVAVIAAEDTRHSRKLLTHFGISTPLTSCHEHNERGKSAELLQRLQAGDSVALISDAGTPLVSDPGHLLVERCRAAGVAVIVVPGPSAVVAALSISGMPCDRFAFEGFLPARKKARDELLATLAQEPRTLVFYEAPHRLLATLEAVIRLLGKQREVAVARELTKMHEEFFRGQAAEVLAHFQQASVRGEIVLLISPEEKTEEKVDAAAVLRQMAQNEDLPPSELVRRAARRTGIGRSELYRLFLQMKNQGELE